MILIAYFQADFKRINREPFIGQVFSFNTSFAWHVQPEELGKFYENMSSNIDYLFDCSKIDDILYKIENILFLKDYKKLLLTQ